MRPSGSIRRQLLTLALLPAGVALPLLGLALAGWGSSALDALLVTKVRSDLAVAHGYLERVRVEMGANATALADSQALQSALARGATLAELGALLQRFKQRERLDFVNLRDAEGRLLATDFGPPPMDSRAAWFAGPASRSAVEVLDPRDFAVIAPALQSRVAVPLLPTRNAAPTERATEERALVLVARAPVQDEAGQVKAYLQAGLLLNRNLDFIDHVNEIVYPEGALPFGSRGTATLFLDDLRVTTNVRLFDGQGAHRAIGTRVSREVREAVLGRGSTWLDRAFVVDDWYVSAYAPLADGQGRRVGMLYVGFLEQPFNRLKVGVLLGIGVLFFAVMGAAAWLSLRQARALYRPLEHMGRTMDEVQAGRPARVGPLQGSSEELAALGAHLDGLLDTVDGQTRALRQANAELDAKVEARTRELRAAQQQLLRSEKMAAIGQLTASIAHEVNNPIAVLQGNLDLMRELLGEHAHRVRDELKLADEQVERMRLIVAQLLQFARPNEYAGYVQAVDVAQALQDCLRLVGPQLARSGVRVRQALAHTRSASINRQELQQVLVNLLLNALQAMGTGGELLLASRDEGNGVALSVTDSGPGLAPEVLRDLFQPFMTTKHDGTGLGLWISHGLIERYGGTLRARNREDGVSGAVFEVWVPGEGAA
ncbi:sensor histidine kinase [Azohydromonas caseinilytica]|uniref:histidine kinase n=1 Tax=Azohydromonas caseinilytica TaxID=2728836 RepID=A0A848F2Z6_9BURK|nr:cache domain-containing protein [Azohydromonas caseinilytica]NML14034.1 two-component sensor histidine kinase [Azohydromonas caseinilytica]